MSQSETTDNLAPTPRHRSDPCPVVSNHQSCGARAAPQARRGDQAKGRHPGCRRRAMLRARARVPKSNPAGPHSFFGRNETLRNPRTIMVPTAPSIKRPNTAHVTLVARASSGTTKRTPPRPDDRALPFIGPVNILAGICFRSWRGVSWRGVEPAKDSGASGKEESRTCYKQGERKKRLRRKMVEVIQHCR
jgi:hypothetical protein